MPELVRAVDVRLRPRVEREGDGEGCHARCQAPEVGRERRQRRAQGLLPGDQHRGQALEAKQGRRCQRHVREAPPTPPAEAWSQERDQRGEREGDHDRARERRRGPGKPRLHPPRHEPRAHRQEHGAESGIGRHPTGMRGRRRPGRLPKDGLVDPDVPTKSVFGQREEPDGASQEGAEPAHPGPESAAGPEQHPGADEDEDQRGVGLHRDRTGQHALGGVPAQSPAGQHHAADRHAESTCRCVQAVSRRRDQLVSRHRAPGRGRSLHL